MENLEVTIHGRHYTLRTDDDPEYVRGLAEMVDKRLKAAERGTKTVDSGRLAVLAALNLADEYCRLETELRARIQEMEQEQARLLDMLNGVLTED